MELGLVGLGKMGGNMRERIRRAGHTVLGYDRNRTSPMSTAWKNSWASSRARAWSG